MIRALTPSVCQPLLTVERHGYARQEKLRRGCWCSLLFAWNNPLNLGLTSRVLKHGLKYASDTSSPARLSPYMAVSKTLSQRSDLDADDVTSHRARSDARPRTTPLKHGAWITRYEARSERRRLPPPCFKRLYENPRPQHYLRTHYPQRGAQSACLKFCCCSDNSAAMLAHALARRPSRPFAGRGQGHRRREPRGERL